MRNSTGKAQEVCRCGSTGHGERAKVRVQAKVKGQRSERKSSAVKQTLDYVLFCGQLPGFPLGDHKVSQFGIKCPFTLCGGGLRPL